MPGRAGRARSSPGLEIDAVLAAQAREGDAELAKPRPLREQGKPMALRG